MVKRWIRPLALPCLHCWQRFHDYSRGKVRQYPDQIKETWRNSRARLKILFGATTILRDVHGVRFVLYPWDRPNLLHMVRRIYDVAEFQAIPRLVRQGDVAFDIGANVGVYAVLLSRLCGPAGRVWAFEPVPDTYWRLRETLALNRCDNVVPVQKAVCEKDGVVQMNLFERQFSEWNSLGTPTMRAPNGGPISPSRSVEVPAQTLDQFCNAQRIERINFLKVDVEGFELSVFRGAERMLREHRVDCICFEISKEPLKGAGIESRQVFTALEAYGYIVYQFDRTTARFQGPIRETSEAWTNFFASRKDLCSISDEAHDARDSKRAREDSLVGKSG